MSNTNTDKAATKIAAKFRRALKGAHECLANISNGCYDAFADEVVAIGAATKKLDKARHEAWVNSLDALVAEIDAAITAVYASKAEAFDRGRSERQRRLQDKIRALDVEIRESRRETDWMKH